MKTISNEKIARLSSDEVSELITGWLPKSELVRIADLRFGIPRREIQQANRLGVLCTLRGCVQSEITAAWELRRNR